MRFPSLFFFMLDRSASACALAPFNLSRSVEVFLLVCSRSERLSYLIKIPRGSELSARSGAWPGFTLPQEGVYEALPRVRLALLRHMAGYDDPAEELYYMDDTAGSFDQDLVYALDAGVRHSVNQALAQAIQPIKHHLLGLVDQQAWAAPVSASTMEDPSFATIPQSEKQLSNPHAADFQSLIRNMAREHDCNAGSQKKGKDAPPSSSSSSEPSSEQEDVPPRKHKKKARHMEVPTPKVLTFEPDDIVHPRYSLWLPPPEVADYVEAHIRHGFDKDISSRLREPLYMCKFSPLLRDNEIVTLFDVEAEFFFEPGSQSLSGGTLHPWVRRIRTRSPGPSTLDETS
ncbi:hypothetical protein NDU88_008185 [Pleurodeles waltl]|uniref:Uncharacterized protein n=1 Tax=Pleurodeles waltl TaxID=8319 RepID=A0AAV7QR27_PLEWA|nr:hypothetical protein NDU88_008185 [Pleurodeles waltl]